jgi:hypothetical protein
MKNSFRFYRGGSMRATFRSGDCIIFEEVSTDSLRTGDVVVFRSTAGSGTDIVHRIVSLDDESIEVKGDNNPSDATETVPRGNILGKVSAVERNGRRLPVAGGRPGTLWARLILREGLPRKAFRVLYRLLRRSGLVRMFWRPEIESIGRITDDESVVRLISGGRTIGRWCPGKDILVLRKPWDLVVRREKLQT